LNKQKVLLKKTGIILFWIAVWEILALIIGNDIIFCSPAGVIKALFSLLKTGSFYETVLTSFLRIIAGFLIALVSGIFVAIAAYRNETFRAFMDVPVRLVKSIPVASFIILVLLWVRSAGLSTVIAFLTVFPVIYINILNSLSKTDKKLIEMAEIFEIKKSDRIRYIYMEEFLPGLKSAISIGLGFCFKSGIAAEVIGLPERTIGSRLYESKLYLMTDELFAWTAVVIFISVGFEKLVMKLMENIMVRHELTDRKEVRTADSKDKEKASAGVPDESELPGSIELSGVCKRFCDSNGEEKKVVENISLKTAPGERICIKGASGTGKTTLLNIVAGLIQAETGKVLVNGKVSYMFQEDRLIDNLSGYDNIMIMGETPAKERVWKFFGEAGLDSEMNEQTAAYSGGMKRRTALLRTLLMKSDILLLDEPFNGMDEAVKRKMAELINTYSADKTVILISHDEDDAELLNCEIKQLW